MRYPTRHALLDQLPPEERTRLASSLSCVILQANQLLFEAGQPVSAVYFPVTAQVEEGLPMSADTFEVLRHIQADGVVGSCVLGDPLATRTARVSQAGEAFRMGFDDFVRELDELPGFRERVLQDAMGACVMLALA